MRAPTLYHGQGTVFFSGAAGAVSVPELTESPRIWTVVSSQVWGRSRKSEDGVDLPVRSAHLLYTAVGGSCRRAAKW